MLLAEMVKWLFCHQNYKTTIAAFNADGNDINYIV